MFIRLNSSSSHKHRLLLVSSTFYFPTILVKVLSCYFLNLFIIYHSLWGKNNINRHSVYWALSQSCTGKKCKPAWEEKKVRSSSPFCLELVWYSKMRGHNSLALMRSSILIIPLPLPHLINLLGNGYCRH